MDRIQPESSLVDLRAVAQRAVKQLNVIRNKTSLLR